MGQASFTPWQYDPYRKLNHPTDPEPLIAAPQYLDKLDPLIGARWLRFASVLKPTWPST